MRISFRGKKIGQVIALATTHVDDIALTADLPWLDKMNQMFVKRFGKVTRQQLPFDHCGCHYEKMHDGYKISQEDFAKKMESVVVPEREDESKLTPVEVTSLRSALGGLLWLTATRLDIIADVSILQSRVTVSQIKDLKYANQILQKVKEFSTVGLHYRVMESPQVRLVCIHDASSASQGRHYAQEGLLICLAEDKFAGEEMDFETVFEDGEGPQGVERHGGFMRVLFASGSKAKRVSYSTSHAETLSMVGGMEASTLIMVRLAEIMHKEKAPTLAQLTKIQEEGVKQLPVDYYGDCRDVFELLTGQRTLPQDKSQRLYILSLKEARLVGKMRLLTLVPTQCMTSDALTKPLVHESRLLLLTAGIVRFFNVDGHPVVSRLLPTLGNYDEHDIVKDDEEIKEMVKEKKKDTTLSHAMILLGMVGSFRRPASKMFLAGAMIGTASAYEVAGYSGGGQQASGDVNYIGVYFLIFLTVIAAITVEKLGKHFILYLMYKYKVTIRNPMKVKTEDDDDDAIPMDVDQTFMHGFDRRTSGDQPMEMKRAKRKLQALEEDKQELEATITIKEDAIFSLQKQLAEKKREAGDWEQRLERAKNEMLGLNDKETRLKDEMDEMDEKMGKLHIEKTALDATRMDLEEKLENLRGQNQRNLDLLNAANRQVLTLKDRVAEKEKLLQERIPLFGHGQARPEGRAEGGLFQEPAAAMGPQEARLISDVERQKREIADKTRQVEVLRQERAQLREQLVEAKAPAEIFCTRYGNAYHRADCNHLKHGQAERPRTKLQRCRDCLE